MPIEKPDFDNTLNREFKAKKITVTSTEQIASTGLLTNEREKLVLYVLGNQTVFIGPTGVSHTGTSEGIPIDKDEFFEDDVSSDVEYYLVTQTGTSEVIVWEYS